MFPVSITRIVKIASVVKSLFTKVTEEITAFCSSFENSIKCIGVFRKVALLVISRNKDLMSTDCNVIKNELLTNVFKGVLKTFEKF